MSETNNKLDRRIIRSRKALREAMLTLMSQKPLAAISITEIVELADYNRGTFYSNYDNKEALLDDIFAELIDQLLQSFRAPYQQVEMFSIQDLPASSVMIFEHFYQHASIYTVLAKSEVLPQLREKMFIALKHITQEELVYPEHEIDRELHAIYSIHALLGLVFYWVESGFQHSTSYMQEQLVKIINWRPTVAKTVMKGSDG
ncbi:TetR/AcrR family transcriptional regulator [Paenibacillus sp. H1-7]|uniref:TetR/AcrR family transcriptional regulator n=1 Tax=Paenibacillus sp. H1-7 TaxID=2282849 RepID=UPI001EF8E69E|nr:TetR/AcrR family transcriptional regulator [Paenibacillus sp. H1-7]ULL16035.1 TetR/AcrR family transcriptional regulator [Paenibacillus sp. H1-7]